MRFNSQTLYDGNDRAGARAMMKGIGFTDEDLKKPIIGIANTWIETMPCNYNLRRLAKHVKEGVRAAGGTPMEFNTVAISDGVTMGTEGMKASLISREVIADSVELVGRGHMFDAIIGLGACDKTLPGLVDGPRPAQRSVDPDLWWLDHAGLLARQGSHDSLDLRGDWRQCRRQPERRRPQVDGRCRLPGRRCMWRPVHGEHDGDGDGVHRPLAAGQRLGAGNRSPQGRDRRKGRRADHGRACAAMCDRSTS